MINPTDDIKYLISRIELICMDQMRSRNLILHGIQHSRQVAFLACRLALNYNINIKDVAICGYLHDCARINDSEGILHAHESANLAKNIIEKRKLTPNIDKILYSIYYHADGMTTNDPFIGCVWDSDRLSLLRLGILPDSKMLSTQIAKRFHSFYKNYKKNQLLLSHINIFANRVYEKSKKFGSVAIGLWYSDTSIMVLQILLNILEIDYDFNFENLFIQSLFEFKDIPKGHDQSCCYQIYRNISNRFSLNQVRSPIEVLTESDLIYNDIPCIICCENNNLPAFDFSMINCNNICSYPVSVNTRHYLSRFYEKINNTPDSYITFSKSFYSALKNPIIITNYSNSNLASRSVSNESWLNNSYKINQNFNL